MKFCEMLYSDHCCILNLRRVCLNMGVWVGVLSFSRLNRTERGLLLCPDWTGSVTLDIRLKD